MVRPVLPRNPRRYWLWLSLDEGINTICEKSLHKFYLGQTGLGIVYLIFFWTFIPALIGLVEAIRLLLMSDVEFAQRYGEK